MKTIMRKTINLGKIAYCRNRRINPVDVTIELRECGGEPTYLHGIFAGYTPTYTELSICGNIWNARHTDIVCGGQCIDTIAEYVRTPKMQQILAMWQKFHLNGMNAGTTAQEEAIAKYKAENGGRYTYKGACEYLKSLGLYEVEYTGKTVGRMYDHEPYRYGSAWIVNDLPEYVIKWAKEV